eukprot:319032-Prymnesium_polylepis.1
MVRCVTKVSGFKKAWFDVQQERAWFDVQQESVVIQESMVRCVTRESMVRCARRYEAADGQQLERVEQRAGEAHDSERVELH